jgi:hypothetical protein
MNQERFNDAVRLAAQRLRRPDLPPTSSGLEGDDLVAFALLSAAGAGPFEERAARLKAWADEREDRFVAVRDVLEAAGITTEHGNLEDQVRVLVARRIPE